jgi:hypothetical protein
MKKNIFLSMVLALNLCVGSSAVATTFCNETNRNIHVIGVGGTGWDVGAKGSEQFEGCIPVLGILPDNAGRFPAGLRDNLTIRLGKKAGLFGGHGGAQAITFDLKEIKEHFWIIDRAVLREKQPFKFTLDIVGKVKGNPKAAHEKLAQLCLCLADQTADGKSTFVRGIRTKTALEQARAESKARD